MRNSIIQKASIAVGLLILSFSSALAGDPYKSDQGHTEVFFGWSHAGGVTQQHGEFTKAKAVLRLNEEDVEQSTLSVTIKTDSLHSGFRLLDDSLKSDHYLDVANYPTITFNSTSITRTGDTTADVIGDLTILDTTLPVTLKTTLTHQGEHPMASYFPQYRGQWLAFSAAAEIDHMAFDVGSFTTGPITIEIRTEMKQTKY